MKSTWITHKGKKIFYAHYEYLDINSMRMEGYAVEEELFQQPLRSVLLTIDITGVALTPDIVNFIKDIIWNTTQHIRKTALIGMENFTYFKFFLTTIYRFSEVPIVPFPDEYAAKDWLVR